MKKKQTLASLGIEVGILDLSKVDAELAKLKTIVDRNSRDVSRSLNAMASSTSKAMTEAFRTSGKTIAGFGSAFKTGAGFGAGMMAVNSVRKLPGVLLQTVADASALRSTEQRLQLTFGNLTEDARKFAKEFSKQVGTAETATKNMLARFNATLEQTHISPERRSAASKTMARLASDMAMAWGTDEADASDAMLAALRGEADPIERYGLNLKEAAINAKLFAMGITGGSKAATEAQKVVARLNVIIEQTRGIHGLAAKQTGGYTREIGKLSATWQTFSERVGAALEPAAAHVAKFLGDSLSEIESSLGPVDKLGERMLAASKQWTEALVPMREKLKELMAGLPESIGNLDSSLGKLGSSLGFVGDAIGAVIGRLKDLDSMNGSWSDWLRGRLRGDDQMSMLFGSGPVNSMNARLGDLASTRTTTSEERDASVANARMPVIKRMAHMIESALSGIMRLTHGQRPLPPRMAVAGLASTSQQFAALPDAGFAPAPSIAAAAGGGGVMPGFEEMTLDRKPGARSPWMDWGRRALKSTTGIDMGRSQWSRMTIEEKRQKLTEMAEASGEWLPGGAAKWIGGMDEKHLDRRIKQAAKGGNADASGLLGTGNASDQVFGGIKSPFTMIGEALGKMAGTATTLSAGGINAFADFDKAEQERASGRVGFMGLQDVQRNLQGKLDDDEARKDKIKIELARKAYEANQEQLKAMTAMPSNLASALKGLMGLQ